MTVQDIIAALDLPGSCRVEQRVPKKLLVENGAPTASDKRQINDGIEEIQWLAALKPNTIGVPEYRDDVREYLEIAVLSVTLRANAKPGRLAELVHRAIPYPVVLVFDDGEYLYVSLAHIRWAQNETDKTVLDGELMQGAFARTGAADKEANRVSVTSFLSALKLSKQPRADLFSLYQGWLDTIFAWQAAAITGRFKASTTREEAADRRSALRRCRELDAQIASLRSAASSEKQIARQAAANLKMKALLAERQQAADSL